MKSQLWDPQIDFDGNYTKAHRKQARPKSRWSDEFTKFANLVYSPNITWNELSRNQHFWHTYEDQFSKASNIS